VESAMSNAGFLVYGIFLGLLLNAITSAILLWSFLRRGTDVDAGDGLLSEHNLTDKE
jgi:hypothetical protein